MSEISKEGNRQVGRKGISRERVLEGKVVGKKGRRDGNDTKGSKEGNRY